MYAEQPTWPSTCGTLQDSRVAADHEGVEATRPTRDGAVTGAMDHGGEGLTRPVTDGVTGADPRALLQPRIDEELARAGRAGGAFAVFLFDVDFFKTVNDAY